MLNSIFLTESLFFEKSLVTGGFFFLTGMVKVILHAVSVTDWPFGFNRF